MATAWHVESTPRRADIRFIRFILIILVNLLLVVPAQAHEGPPYPIIVDQPSGPYVITVWADPDVGTGTFYVTLEAADGGELPEELAVEIAVQPSTGRLAEASHRAEREPIRGRVQYMAEVPFDAQEMWRVRVTVEGSPGRGEAATEVEVTPPGLGSYDLIFYLLPFVAIGFLWARAAFRRRRVPQG